MPIGEKIKNLRKNMKYTQEELASSLGVVRSTIIAWEKGTFEPEGDNLKKLAKFFHTSVAYLLDETEDTSLDPHTIQPQNDSRSKTRIMFDELMMKMAAANPDLIIHFRDLQNNIDKLTPGDIQALADSYAYITSQANEEVEKRLKKTSRHGDI